MTNLEYALNYLSFGWNIIPLYAKTKIPNGKCLLETGFVREGKPSWLPLQELRVTKDLIREWFKIAPDAGIALVCGSVSGITVIDIDYKKYKYPDREWIDPYKLAFDCSEPIIINKSGGGGLHIFCRYEKGIHNSCGLLHPQIDIKNDGGLIILPPSIHAETGTAYAFDPFYPLSKDGLRQIPSFPKIFKDILLDKQKTAMGDNEWLSILSGVNEGIRDRTGAQMAGKIVHGFEKTFGKNPEYLPILWDFMQFWNQKNNPPMDEIQLQKIFKSIVSKTY